MKPKTDKAAKGPKASGVGKLRAGKTNRAFYNQGRKRVYLESLEGRMALKYSRQSKERIREAINDFGQIRDLDTQGLFIIDFADETDRVEAVARLKELIDNGLIEFLTPLLIDEQSQLLQILTDEINVRFKQVPTSRQIKAIEQKYGIKVARRNEFVPNQFVVKTSRPLGLNALEVASQMDAEDGVEFAVPNFISEHQR